MIILKWPDISRIGERGLDLRGLGQAQVAGNEPVGSVIKQSVCRQVQEVTFGVLHRVFEFVMRP